MPYYGMLSQNSFEVALEASGLGPCAEGIGRAARKTPMCYTKMCLPLLTLAIFIVLLLAVSFLVLKPINES